MRKSEQESEAAEQYEVRWRLDKDADKEEGRGAVDSGVRNSDGDGTVGLLSSGEGPAYLIYQALLVSFPLPLSATPALLKLPSALQPASSLSGPSPYQQAPLGEVSSSLISPGASLAVMSGVVD